MNMGLVSGFYGAFTNPQPAGPEFPSLLMNGSRSDAERRLKLGSITIIGGVSVRVGLNQRRAAVSGCFVDG